VLAESAAEYSLDTLVAGWVYALTGDVFTTACECWKKPGIACRGDLGSLCTTQLLGDCVGNEVTVLHQLGW